MRCGMIMKGINLERNEPTSVFLRQPSEGIQDEHVSPPVIVRDFAFDPSEHEHGPVYPW
jgi:hypothetical protein